MHYLIFYSDYLNIHSCKKKIRLNSCQYIDNMYIFYYCANFCDNRGDQAHFYMLNTKHPCTSVLVLFYYLSGGGSFSSSHLGLLLKNDRSDLGMIPFLSICFFLPSNIKQLILYRWLGL